MGVPVVGCHCEVCTSPSPFNKRLRPSVLIRAENKTILMDTGPDFRTQLLREQIDDLDGVILTHAHHDHTAAVDELRVFFMKPHLPIPVLLSADTAADIKQRYYYMFDKQKAEKTLTASLEFQILKGSKGKLEFCGIPVRFVTFEQGGMKVNGFCFGDLAYLSDIHRYDDSIFEELRGIKTLVISALRFTPSYMHLSVDEAVDFSLRIKAQQTWLTHISHDLDHDKTNAYLPSNVRMAYDGLEVEFSD